jgi:hypothetical protein
MRKELFIPLLNFISDIPTGCKIHAAGEKPWIPLENVASEIIG